MPNDSNKDDDEAYGHTQMLSTQPENVHPGNRNLIKPASEFSTVTAVQPIKKAKFGLPGIAPIPSKIKDNINSSNHVDNSSHNWKSGIKKETAKSKFGLPSLNNKSQSFPGGKEKSQYNTISASSLSHSNSRDMYPSEKIDHSAASSDVNTNLKQSSFRTAHEQWVIDNQKRFGKNSRVNQVNPQLANGYGANSSRSLGIPKVANNFKPPINNQAIEDKGGSLSVGLPSEPGAKHGLPDEPPLGDERLRGIDARMVETIENGKHEYRNLLFLLNNIATIKLTELTIFKKLFVQNFRNLV